MGLKSRGWVKRRERPCGKPMEHWEAMAKEMVVEGIVRAALNCDPNCIPGAIARRRLMAIARAEDPEVFKKVLEIRDRCIEGMATAINSFMLTDEEREEKYGRQK